MVDECIKDIAANQNPYNLSQYVKAYMNRGDVMSEVCILPLLPWSFTVS